jgi:hypothetical protein
MGETWDSLTGKLHPKGSRDISDALKKALKSGLFHHNKKDDPDLHNIADQAWEKAGRDPDTIIEALEATFKKRTGYKFLLSCLKTSNRSDTKEVDSSAKISIREKNGEKPGEGNTIPPFENDSQIDFTNQIIESFLLSLQSDPTANPQCRLCHGKGIELMVLGIPAILAITGYKYHPCRGCHPNFEKPVGLTTPLIIGEDQVYWPRWPKDMDHDEICAQISMIQRISDGNCKGELEKEEKRNRKKDYLNGYVYFVQGTEGSPIKIGWANNPKDRLKTLQTASPVKLKIIGIFPGTQEIEKFCHKVFSHLGIGGEWFNPEEELLAFIERLCDGKK